MTYTKHPGRGGRLRAPCRVFFRWRTRPGKDVKLGAWYVRVKRPNGQWTSVSFYVGTENAYTERRDREQKRAAERLAAEFEQWYESGGEHPLKRLDRERAAARREKKAARLA